MSSQVAVTARTNSAPGTNAPARPCCTAAAKRTQLPPPCAKCTNEFPGAHVRTRAQPSTRRLPAPGPHDSEAADGVLRDLKGKPARALAPVRRCPRNCRRRAAIRLRATGPTMAREGGSRRRAASQETCRRLDHSIEPGGVHRWRQPCAIRGGGFRRCWPEGVSPTSLTTPPALGERPGRKAVAAPADRGHGQLDRPEERARALARSGSAARRD